ncbi:2-keto-4-pentenoate hydratase [Povalibacter sp.]|uniref:2-keto-4-pentenoate hydratase n=1 Tax=Povalibacter sp. TaxID=1962978 RepID=UPI002F401718
MLNHRSAIAVTIALYACMTLSACISPQQRVVTEVIEASRRSDALPLPHLIDETLTIAEAYRVQKRVALAQLRGAQPGGFKAGLTSAQSQARFRTDAPVAGVLPRDGLLPADATLRLSELRGLNIETEIAMRIGTPIRSRIPDANELRKHIDGIAPAIELPNLHFVALDQADAMDIIATNVGAAAYIVGDFVSPATRDPNEPTPRLACNGNEINKGHARDALGDQWEAARFLVNTMLEQGWALEPGQILLTGALGRMIPASVGDCSADYGNWGTITFHIVQ